MHDTLQEIPRIIFQSLSIDMCGATIDHLYRMILEILSNPEKSDTRSYARVVLLKMLTGNLALCRVNAMQPPAPHAPGFYVQSLNCSVLTSTVLYCVSS